MVSIIEGLGKDDCDTLHNFEGEIQDLIDQRQKAYYDEFTGSGVDHEKLEDLSEDIEKAKSLKSAVSGVRTAGCGVYFEDPETDDESDIPCDDFEEFHDDVDEMIESVSETVPEYIPRDDAAYDEIAGEENKKVIFQDGAQEVKDRVRDFDDDCTIEETDHREARAAMQIECKVAPWESREECLDSYRQFEVESSGVTTEGESIPQRR